MAVDWVYLQQLESSIQAKLACAGQTLPFTLRTADFYTLQSDGSRIADEIRAVITQRTDPAAQALRDDIARRAWAFHARLNAFLAGVEDTAACAAVDFGMGAPDVPGLPDGPPPPPQSGGGIGPGLVWGGVLALAVVGAGWALTR